MIAISTPLTLLMQSFWVSVVRKVRGTPAVIMGFWIYSYQLKLTMTYILPFERSHLYEDILVKKVDIF